MVLGIASLCCACTKPVDVPKNENFNEGWLFTKNGDTLMQPAANATWENVTLPHTTNVESMVVSNQWQGICFYKKEFTLSNSHSDKELSLQFDAAMNVADVWVNGIHTTHHLGGYLPFVIKLNGLVRYDSVNTVLVRLDNRDNPVTGPKPLNILDFNMYGGLYRNAHLLVKNKIHLTNPINANTVAGGGVFFTTTSASDQKASFAIKTQMVNNSDKAAKIVIKHQLIDQTGRVMSSISSEPTIVEANTKGEFNLQGELEQPNLWSPSNPNLYSLKTEVFADDERIDEQTDKVGIRTIKITPEGLWLNGQKTFLRGVNRHQEYPYVGYAISDEAQYRDAYKIKQAGFDYVRCSHYPMSPAFLDACDELGIMVLDAILGWQYFGDSQFEKFALQSSRDLIRRDRNHASILAWELSINETAMPASFIDSANIIAHEEYPYNSCYSAGWVRQSYDIYIEARQHRHGLFPEKPLLVSEYGDWEYYAQNAGFNQQAWQDLMEAERTSRQPRESGEKRMLQQATNIQEAHNDNLSTHAFGDGYWVMFDYNRGMAPDLEYSGVMDICRLPKFSTYFFQSQRNISDTEFGKPMIFIASFWQPGISKGVRVYSNCDEVELFVDGTSVGRQKPDKNNISNNLFHPPFSFSVNCEKPGSLKAVGYYNGKASAEAAVSTAGEPENIKLVVDESGKTPTTNDIVFVYAYVTDKEGNTINTFNQDVTFTVEGAELMSPAKTQALGGIATALIRTKTAKGSATIKATANQLNTKSIQFQY